MSDAHDETLLTLTADIVAAHVSNNNVAIGDLSALIGRVHQTLAGLGTAAAPAAPELQPAVSVRASVKPDYIVCLEDGRKMTMLKRHLATDHGTTPDAYRRKWGLPADYPMVTPNYAEKRRELAVKSGLGRKPRTAAPVPRGTRKRSTAPTR
jgi:predicted transcriptional regulator